MNYIKIQSLSNLSNDYSKEDVISSFTSDEANHDAKDASEMKISGPTLIKFNNNKIDDYIEGKEEITEYLK